MSTALPQFCDCKPGTHEAHCNCACHLPERDNTIDAHDVEVDQLKAQLGRSKAELEAQADYVATLRGEVERLTVERDVARTELAATKTGAAQLHTSLMRSQADQALLRTRISNALAKLSGEAS